MMNVNLATEGDSIMLEDSNENGGNVYSHRGDSSNSNQQLTKQTLKNLPSMPSQRKILSHRGTNMSILERTN